MKCSTCNDEPMSYYGVEVFCADCNDECEPRLKDKDILYQFEIDDLVLYGNIIPDADKVIEKHIKAFYINNEIGK